MNVLENRIPPPIIALVCALIIGWISRVAPVLDISVILRVCAATVFFAVGLYFSIAGLVAFRRAKTTVNPLKPATASSLVNSGVYRISRNPMYVGFAFFLLSLVIFLSSPVSIIGVFAFILYMNKFQIEPEERALDKIFGIEFPTYKRSVRRWL